MNFSKNFAGLPVLSAVDAVNSSLAAHNDVVLSAPPGSGKTTGVPPLLLAKDWLKGRKIIMLEPRRLAARMAATRIAELLGEAVGQTVGYRIRFETKISARTRIEVVTEGILTRLLQNDPDLEDYGLVIFDEFHERSVHADLALALCLDSKENLRDDLRLLIMSATLDVDAVAELLVDAEVISAAGRSFPVDIFYPEGRLPGQEQPGRYNSRIVVEQMTAALRRAITDEKGGILAFLPGAGEINKVAGNIAACADKDMEILALHGSLPKNIQDKAVLPSPDGRRKIVLSTPIAETSLTIAGISIVVDSGWARYPKFDANSGLTRLETRRISKASATQRAGRAGRLAPGKCYRLWDKAVEYSMLNHTPPEILDTDLAQLVLELASWGVRDAGELHWLDIPPMGHFEQARQLLQGLGAFDDEGRINVTGKKLATLPLHPRLAAMILMGQELGAVDLACDIAALLSERDIIMNRRQTTVDLEKRLQVLAYFRAGNNHEVQANGASPDACRRVEQSSRQWQSRLTRGPKKAADITAGNLLAFAYPDRIGKLRTNSRESYLLANGRGAKLPPADLLGSSEYLVIPQLDAGRAEGMIYLAVHIAAADIDKYHRRLIGEYSEIRWDAGTAAVTAREERRIQGIILSRRKIKKPDPEGIKIAMLDGVQQMGLDSLPWDKQARDIQARVLCLRDWQPQSAWPDLGDEHLLASLAEWLAPYLDGIKRRDHLGRLNLSDILLSKCDWQLRQQLDKDAPTHITVPSGSRVRLQYNPGEPPVLAVRLQEMFGLADTPAVCSGRIPVILHLLSPAGRPMQMTRDLRGFWDGIYTEVKKELKGRYPKHHWPDDPWSAQPTARVKRRKGRGNNGKS